MSNQQGKTEVDVVASTHEYEQGGDMRPSAHVRREEHPAHRDSNVVEVIDGTRLSAFQRQRAHELLRLYQSLCGGVPGQYAPQSLLDTANTFNRPAFPGRPPKPQSTPSSKPGEGRSR